MFAKPRIAALTVLAFLLTVSAGAAASWEAAFWKGASPATREYICQYLEQPPEWCDELPPAQVYTREVAEPENEAGDAAPPKDDERWQQVLTREDAAQLTPEDIALVRRMAMQYGEPVAMEILGYIHAEGLGVTRHLEESYLWYAKAFLGGLRHVKRNMNIVWEKLVKADPDAARRLRERAASLAAAEPAR